MRQCVRVNWYSTMSRHSGTVRLSCQGDECHDPGGRLFSRLFKERMQKKTVEPVETFKPVISEETRRIAIAVHARENQGRATQHCHITFTAACFSSTKTELRRYGHLTKPYISGRSQLCRVRGHVGWSYHVLLLLCAPVHCAGTLWVPY